MEEPSSYTFKCVTLGEGRVGKSSLIIRYTLDAFDEEHPPTMKASFVEKRINIESCSIVLNLWDTAGQERFHALGPIYYRDADAALLVFDVTDEESFVKVKRWISELRTMVADDIPICLAGNKSDLEKERTVDKSVAEDYAKSAKVELFWTSALTNKSVDACFLYLARAALTRAKELAKTSTKGDDQDNEKLILSEAVNQRKNPEDGQCCV
jgi:Ras-related protein Rab-21